MLIGYARVSTHDQNLDLQKDALEKDRMQKDICRANVRQFTY